MFVNCSFWVAVFIILSFSEFTFGRLLSSETNNDGKSDFLVLVGIVGTKNFFTSKNISTWIEAQEFCNNAQIGMQLATVDTIQEKVLIVEFLKANFNSNRIFQFKLSGTDYGTEGEFHWMKSGKAVEFDVLQELGDKRFKENCLKLQYDGLFLDASCYNYSSFGIWPLCEIQSETPTTTTTIRTTTIETTTTAAPSPFECPSEGKHPDPFKCTVFHECVPYQGGFLDYVVNCPEFTNYCADQEMCGHPDECPCDSDTDAYASDKIESPGYHHIAQDQFDHIRVEFIGKVGSKNFYTYEKDYTPNLIESLEICHRNGMMLARMESDEERSFMLNYMSLNYYIDYFWLSGMDYGTEDSYYWINSGDQLTRSVAGNGGRQNNCLYLASNGLLYDWSCTKNSNYKMRPLCQTLD